MQSASLFQRRSLLKLLVVLFILAIATFATLPDYMTGNWSWTRQPDVPHLDRLRELRSEGLSLSGWEMLEQQETRLGGHRWSVQANSPEVETPALADPILLLLRPQADDSDMPQVDWMDINGAQQWTVDHRRRLSFPVPDTTLPLPTPFTVQARFFRGWTQQGTFAVMQWYAWPNGGHPAPGQWFWADQITQLRDRQKLPWVAVSVLIPIKPLGDIETVRDTATSLGTTIHTALLQQVFQTETPE
jgi:cyanoexosortase B-associated protein